MNDVTLAQVTFHARQRAREMGVSLERVLRIARNPSMTYPSRGGQVAWRSDDPTVALVLVHETKGLVVVTVVPRTQEEYVRQSSSGS